MPYNPGVQDISGELLARGITQRTQALTGLVSDFMKTEDERQKTTGVIKGFLSDPYYQQQISSNPELASYAQKVQKGTANLADVRQFLGTMTTMQGVREQQMKNAQMQSQQAYTQALRDQAIATAAATQAATDERQRQIEREALAEKTLSDILTPFTSPPSPEDPSSPFTSQPSPEEAEYPTAPMGVRDIAREYAKRGAPMTPAVASFLNQLGQQELGAERITENTRIAIERARAAQAAAEAKAREKIPLGEKRPFKIEGQEVLAEWAGERGWIDPESGLPIFTTATTYDKLGFKSGTETNVPNPRLFPPSAPRNEVPVFKEPSPTGAPAPKPAVNFPTPNEDQIEALRSNPERKAEFDRKFGPGSADRIFGR